MEEEEFKISRNKNLTFVDKHDAMKSARSLSRTIDGLIGKTKDHISEYYESQLKERSLSPDKQIFGKSIN